eukprot:TRINITY_DN6871_c0_g2_i3.p1 TRINITY_DN6871_c0_g2~~TRINITY_DN6871_c0_g2_i3.p1  ORF type:complete len:237 (-),score=5.67 TRINITY_DN6871_c0_g2_i3:509-1219(-)
MIFFSQIFNLALTQPLPGSNPLVKSSSLPELNSLGSLQFLTSDWYFKSHYPYGTLQLPVQHPENFPQQTNTLHPEYDLHLLQQSCALPALVPDKQFPQQFALLLIIHFPSKLFEGMDPEVNLTELPRSQYQILPPLATLPQNFKSHQPYLAAPFGLSKPQPSVLGQKTQVLQYQWLQQVSQQELSLSTTLVSPYRNTPLAFKLACPVLQQLEEPLPTNTQDTPLSGILPEVKSEPV